MRIALAERYGALLAPVGTLFAAVNAAHPEINLYWRDGAHASPAGSYLIAATLAACLLHPESLDAVTDESNDFQVQFGEKGERPSAKEDLSKIHVTLPQEHARAIRETIERALLR